MVGARPQLTGRTICLHSDYNIVAVYNIVTTVYQVAAYCCTVLPHTLPAIDRRVCRASLSQTTTKKQQVTHHCEHDKQLPSTQFTQKRKRCTQDTPEEADHAGALRTGHEAVCVHVQPIATTKSKLSIKALFKKQQRDRSERADRQDIPRTEALQY